ncbi:hypothetical protein OCGS_0229 [Oceaniovalibus guishaninsula JLT2003]|uniref:DUF1850 domain-containing protein n=1 Tax=Oceaniovalibus guishaninsula JLT2003 TaxID=1231392 RepID=K2HGP6_9RHOB|nr:DUF1850 domain-containing protein [Oceaniovalibus guishaninsula]EKE45612.1 hypothetical protein OCGS_0229 [Oceaniovalibus guishaninsula JLT2003]
MTACLAIGAAILHLAAPGFTLSWTHSVERVEWREVWRVDPAGLSLQSASVEGSGAGMEPGPNAAFRDGRWTWPGDLTVPRLTLAASGATGGGWTLCADGECRVLGTDRGQPVTLAPC